MQQHLNAVHLMATAPDLIMLNESIQRASTLPQFVQQIAPFRQDLLDYQARARA
jgi:hypothetical protein